jgi:hypothetical protein
MDIQNAKRRLLDSDNELSYSQRVAIVDLIERLKGEPIKEVCVNPMSFITFLRKSDKYIETIYLNGGCYQLYLVLSSIFPSAEPYLNKSKDHIVTKIDGFFYDIRGIYEDSVVDIPLNMIDEIKGWSFSKTMMLSIGECSFCEEPFLIPTDLCHLKIKGE